MKIFELVITAVATSSRLECMVNYFGTVHKLWLRFLKFSIENVHPNWENNMDMTNDNRMTNLIWQTWHTIFRMLWLLLWSTVKTCFYLVMRISSWLSFVICSQKIFQNKLLIFRFRFSVRFGFGSVSVRFRFAKNNRLPSLVGGRRNHW